MPIKYPSIPKNIIVHLGAPQENARNVTIPFPEYIKNVASGEIYPNWPDEAVKANILAQISFSLNRVYNEWYTSKGYNFDITNNPSYDQSFKENRQFFKKISNIVDEIFNNYIVKDNQIQPYFSMYCDGRVVKCKGLSQWGTVKLANEGKNYLEILKYYYGNIKIVKNAKVEDNIKSYPDFVVKLGTAGDFVRTIKQQLNRIGQNYPAIPIIIDDSQYFTIETENAVKTFQKIFELKSTGEVDKSTWYKIKYIYNAVKKISDLYSEGISIDEATLLFNKNLSYGERGQYVKTLHYLLNVISYFDSSLPFYDINKNLYGSKTKELVTAFQKKYNLPQNGIVDKKTWKKIKEVYDQTIRTIPTTYYTVLDEFYPGRFMSKGMTGDDVINLQKFLYIICEEQQNIPGVTVNGIYDELTEESVRTIQKRNNLIMDGVVGPITWSKIVKTSKNKI